MALVRRAAVDGRQSTPAPPATGFAVPRQPSAADIDEGAPGASTGTGTGTGTTVEEVAAAPDRPARLWALALALALAAAGGGLAFLIDERYAVTTMPLASEAAAVAALILSAAAVERLLEPFTRWLPGRRARNRYEQQLADLANRVPQATLASVADAKARVDQRRAERAALTWGLATLIATVLAAAAGFHLLRILVFTDASAWQVVPVWADALATGLIVGAGTKPVHDLVMRLQQTNAQRRDPTAV